MECVNATSYVALYFAGHRSDPSYFKLDDRCEVLETVTVKSDGTPDWDDATIADGRGSSDEDLRTLDRLRDLLTALGSEGV